MNTKITTSAAIITTATVANTAIITLITKSDVDPGNRSASKVVRPGAVDVVALSCGVKGLAGSVGNNVVVD